MVMRFLAIVFAPALSWALPDVVTVREKTPSPADIVKFLCSVASQKDIEEKAVSGVCDKVTQLFPQIKFDPDCKTVVESFWDAALEMCPMGGDDLGIDPAMIEKLICELATAKMIEEGAVGEVCDLIDEYYPSMKWDPDCKTVLEQYWDAAVAMCPKLDENVGITPEEIEKLICEVASSKMIEEHAVDEICEEIAKVLPVPLQECESLVDSVWDAAIKRCPKGADAYHTPEDIEKLICEFGSAKIEDRAVGEVCAVLSKEFPSTQFHPDCRTVLEAYWDEAVAMCPKEVEELNVETHVAVTPEEIEKLICEFATQKEMEEGVVEKVCNEITEKLPWIKFEPDCKTALETYWDLAMAMCPKFKAQKAQVRITPEDIEKLICEFATSKMVEDHAVGAICDEISKLAPVSHAECEALVESAWDMAVAQCPKGLQDDPFWTRVEKFLCKYLTQKSVEDPAVDALCTEIKKVFPALQFDPDCKTVIDAVWDDAVAKCPKNPAPMEEPRMTPGIVV